MCQPAAAELGSSAGRSREAQPFPCPGSPLDLLPFSGAVGREECDAQVVNTYEGDVLEDNLS